MNNPLEYLWMPIKIFLFGSSISLHPAPCTIGPEYQSFKANHNIGALSELAALYVQTDGLESVATNKIIEGNYHTISQGLGLDQINVFLVRGSQRICKLELVGLATSKESNEAIFRCETHDISGEQFDNIQMNSIRPIHVKALRWNNA